MKTQAGYVFYFYISKCHLPKICQYNSDNAEQSHAILRFPPNSTPTWPIANSY